MPNDVALWRLYALRALYLVNLVLVGAGVITAFVQRTAPWDPISGVAFSFWAALAALSSLGIRHPLAMLPILVLQLTYKTLWLLGVYAPLRAVGRSSDLAVGFLVAAALEMAVIPWTYFVGHFVRARGDRWRSATDRKTE